MLSYNQEFNTRQDISNLLGGDTQKGISPSTRLPVILLFTNSEELYKDYFYETRNYCLYTGIGRVGNQDSIENNMYNLNIDVLTHQRDGKALLLFEKRASKHYFVGKYQLTETHQNIQPDINNDLRRVFVFHLKMLHQTYKIN